MRLTNRRKRIGGKTKRRNRGGRAQRTRRVRKGGAKDDGIIQNQTVNEDSDEKPYVDTDVNQYYDAIDGPQANEKPPVNADEKQAIVQAGEQAIGQAEKQDQDLAEKQDQDLAEKQDQDLAEKQDQDLAEKQDQDLAEDPAEKQDQDLAEDPAEKQDQDLAEKQDQDLAEDPAVEQDREPVGEAVGGPAEDPDSQFMNSLENVVNHLTDIVIRRINNSPPENRDNPDVLQDGGRATREAAKAMAEAFQHMSAFPALNLLYDR